MATTHLSASIALVDNYDSFTNLIAYHIEIITGTEPHLYRNDRVDPETIERDQPDAILISPGPGHPAIARDVGACPEIIRRFLGRVPILGICLGHQILCHMFGAEIRRTDPIRHGEVSRVAVDLDDALYLGIGKPEFDVMRYHSLAATLESLPPTVKVTGMSDDGVVMSMSHRSVQAFGVQYHPESIGTENGWTILQNFLNLVPSSRSVTLSSRGS